MTSLCVISHDSHVKPLQNIWNLQLGQIAAVAFIWLTDIIWQSYDRRQRHHMTVINCHVGEITWLTCETSPGHFAQMPTWFIGQSNNEPGWVCEPSQWHELFLYYQYLSVISVISTMAFVTITKTIINFINHCHMHLRWDTLCFLSSVHAKLGSWLTSHFIIFGRHLWPGMSGHGNSDWLVK